MINLTVNESLKGEDQMINYVQLFLSFPMNCREKIVQTPIRLQRKFLCCIIKVLYVS